MILQMFIESTPVVAASQSVFLVSFFSRKPDRTAERDLNELGRVAEKLNNFIRKVLREMSKSCWKQKMLGRRQNV